MRAIVLSVNKKHICNAGMDESGSISLTFHWGREGSIAFGVGASDYVRDEELDWVVPSLKPGDEFTVQICHLDKTDEPNERRTLSAILEDEQRLLKSLEKRDG